MKKLRTFAAPAIAVWAACAATWVAANLRATYQTLGPASGGLGAVSTGVGTVEGAGILLLVVANIVFWWRLRRAGSLARALHRACFVITAGYVGLVLATVLLVTASLGNSRATGALYMVSMLIGWNTILPTQAFFLASAVTIAGQRADATVLAPRTNELRWRLLASAVLIVEAAAAAYLTLVGWLLSVWFLDDFTASKMVAMDWYFEAASRAAVAILKGAIFAGIAYLVNIRTVAPGFSLRVAEVAALLLGGSVAAAGLAGAAQFAITKPWL